MIQVDGRPTVTAKIGFLPPPDFEAETIADFMVLGHIMTAAPPLNAIPAVVAAAPGIATYNDLSMILPRGWSRSVRHRVWSGPAPRTPPATRPFEHDGVLGTRPAHPWRTPMPPPGRFFRNPI